MKLFVKTGREYVLGGKVYRGGDEVDAPDKFRAILTGSRGPLEEKPAPKPADLPKAAFNPPVAEQPAPLESSPESTGTDTERPRRQYRRKDITAEE